MFRSSGDTPGWDSLAGYADVKQEIEDTLILPLRHPVSGTVNVFCDKGTSWFQQEA